MRGNDMIKLIRVNLLTILVLSGFVISLFFAGGCQAANLQDWKDTLDAGTSGTGLSDSPKSPEETIASVIKVLLTFLGIIFFLLMLYSGFMWMTARGNESQVSTAKDTMIAAIIGLIIIVVSYAVSVFIINALTKGTLG